MSGSVWLHGAGLSGSTWEGVATGATPDLPGHAGAPRASEATVAAFADAIDVPSGSALIGHSLGGMVAMHIAAHRTERVRSLVLAETSYGVRTTVLDSIGARSGLGLAQLLGPRSFARVAAWAERGKTARHVRTQLAGGSREGFRDALLAVLRFDGRDLLPRIAVPTLLLVGSRNPRTHAQARYMAEHMPQATMRVLPGGHMLYRDAPEEFREAVSEHIGERA